MCPMVPPGQRRTSVRRRAQRKAQLGAVAKGSVGATMLGAPNTAHEPAFPRLAVILPFARSERHPNPTIAAYSRISAQAGRLLRPQGAIPDHRAMLDAVRFCEWGGRNRSARKSRLSKDSRPRGSYPKGKPQVAEACLADRTSTTEISLRERARLCKEKPLVEGFTH